MAYAVGLLLLLMGVFAVAAFRLYSSDEEESSQTQTMPETAPRIETDDKKTDESDEEEVVDTEKKHWLVGKTGSVRGKVYHIGQRTVTVGRKPTNFVQLTDEEVSRIHCRFQWTRDGMTISDLDSTVGTLVDGEPLPSETEEILEDGCLIEIGETEFIYHLEGDFETNYEFIEQKAKGEKFEAVTAVKETGEWKRAILAELERAGGDPAEAAKNIGIEEEAFDKLMDEQDITEKELAELK